MPVNLRNEKDLNRYIENLVYHGEKYEAFKPEQLKDKDFIEENRDKIISGMIYQWMKTRVREYLTEAADAPYLEPVTAAAESEPEWLKKALAEGRPVFNFREEDVSQDFYQNLNSIRDCFYSVCESCLDKELSRPSPRLKIDYLKCTPDYGSFEKALAAADEWHADMARKAAKQVYTEADRKRMESGTEFVMDLGDGFTAVKLVTAEALDAESDKMGHCVGQGGYDRAMMSGAIQIYSIRDARGEPHVTFEIQNNLVKQCKGKADRLVVKKYLPYVQKFINGAGLNPYDDAKNMGMVKDVNGVFINMYDIPEKAHFKNLDLSHTEVASLPKGLIVDGCLNLSGTAIEKLPEDLKVNGDLLLSGTKIEALPEHFKTGGSLFADRTPLKSLPSGLDVGGSLDISDTAVSRMPYDMKVGRDLNISRTNITDLPLNLKVNGDFILTRAPVDFLPPALEVSGSLIARGSGLSSFPPGIKVGRDLDLSETAVSSLPDNMSVNGSLLLSHSQVDRFPVGLSVRDSLILNGLYISEVPPDFKTGGDLDLGGTRVTRLPRGLDVGGSLTLRGLSITEIPDDIRVGKDLRLGSSYVEKLPDNLHVGRNLDLSYSSIKVLPRNLTAGGILDISSTSVREIPSGTQVGRTIRAGYSDVALIAPEIDSKKIDGMTPEKIKAAKMAYRKKAAQEEIRSRKAEKSSLPETRAVQAAVRRKIRQRG